MKNESTRNDITHAKPTTKTEVKSYANDPFFVKKGKESKEFFDKHGFPKELLKHR